MSKKIQTYQDLLEEQDKMETLLKAQKELLRLDLQQLKSEMRPALGAVKTVGKLFTRDKDHSVLGLGTERLIDFVFQRFVLNRAGWLARFVVPILVKNLSSHVVAENRDNWMQKLRKLVGKKHHNGRDAAGTGPAAADRPGNQL